MTGNITGISAYAQANQVWSSNQKSKTEKKENIKKADAYVKNDGNVKISEWKPLDQTSSLIPTTKDGYGTVIGDVQLSDKAKEYYSQLKSKFNNLDFILVSKDMKSQVQANASAYGNASKMVVLIDDEKIERMATDESFRKKYEGIIAMAQTKISDAKNSLMNTGANITNFGMNVDENGNISYFATVESTKRNQNKALEKKQAAKKAEKAKEKKKAEKKEAEERLEKKREAKKAREEDRLEKIAENKEYVEFKADNLDDLIKSITKYTSRNSSGSWNSEEENSIGRFLDFKG